MALFHNLFTHKTTTGTGEPFLDALVSLSSNDPNGFVSGSALRNSDIYAAISIIAGDLASNPIKSSSDLYNKMVNDSPNDLMDGRSFKYALTVEMLLNGNSFAEIDRSSHSLNFIPNNKLTLQQEDTTGELTYTYSPDGRIKRVISPKNILHFKCFTRDGLVGLSPLFALRDELKIQGAGNRLMASFFNNGIHGTTVVTAHKTDLSPDGKENIRKQFDDATTGDKALNTIVTDDNMEVKSLPLNTDVLKLVNSNDWTTRQIAKAFGLPPERLGVENEHSNQQQSNVQYLQGTLQHYEDCFTAELNYKLGQDFIFDNSKLLSLDPADQQQMAVDGYVNGLYTRNEARALLNLGPVTNGDNFMEQGGRTTDGQTTNN
ncbi:MAG: phage portal protein [Limosilactobacillus oris]|jgi:HK97 family phage portal protein|uniref:phage portal protein n=1 Tax=Limosilactobacillus oris TaxID=1632 RepID=UPI00242EAE94|nr:phage portal protein [Limosilactobacillus oris]MCH3911279.1 phage portal protein [Limosilactobacillus oris]MCH3938529.1 phage portal protein [Limosilactobacillus oris]MCI1980276.1 phage portal protein [Limosilactobacillus oris]MCI2042633.1 phage portal protein [Limosilactobacillus oris]